MQLHCSCVAFRCIFEYFGQAAQVLHQIETTDPKQLIRQGKTILNSRAEQGKKESEIIFYGGDHGKGHGRRVSHGDYVRVSRIQKIQKEFLLKNILKSTSTRRKSLTRRPGSQRAVVTRVPIETTAPLVEEVYEGVVVLETPMIVKFNNGQLVPINKSVTNSSYENRWRIGKYANGAL